MIDASKFAGHTPGPWLVTNANSFGGSTIMGDARDLLRLGWGSTNAQVEQRKIDLRLMAAAPKLLAERNEALAENERLKALFQSTIAAIRAALVPVAYEIPRKNWLEFAEIIKNAETEVPK